MAASSGPGSVIGRTTTVGASRTSAPRASSAAAERLASSAGRVTTILWPKSGNRSYHASLSAQGDDGADHQESRGMHAAAARRSLRSSPGSRPRCAATARVPDSMIAAGVSPALPSADQSTTDGRQVSDSHVDDQRSRKPRQGGPVEPARVPDRIPGRRVRSRMRRPRPLARCVTGIPAYAVHADPGRHARHDLEGDPRLRGAQCLLGPAPENERVSPFEPDHIAARPRVLDQDLIDLVLGQRAMADRLAGADPAGHPPVPGRAAGRWPDGRTRRRRHGDSTASPRRVKSPGSPGPAPTR